MRGTWLAVLWAVACGHDPAADNSDAALPDAPLAACGIEEPGSRCASATSLERCEGAEIVTEDCSVSDGTCGPNPDADGSACLHAGDDCGDISLAGECEGDVLAYCSEFTDTLVVADCVEVYATCTDDGWADCTTTCDQEGVTAEGTCSGDAEITRCAFADGAYHVEAVACPAGTVCKIVSDTGWPGCMPQDSCPGIGPQGECEDDVLTECVDGDAQPTDCASSGQVCAYAGDVLGYQCADPGTVGDRKVTGLVTYEDRPPDLEGLGPSVSAPARGVAVALVRDSDQAVLSAAVSGDDGSYVLFHEEPTGESIHVLVATTSQIAARPVRVIRPDGLVHGYGAASFAAADSVSEDVLVTDLSGIAPAFNIFDNLVDGMDYVRYWTGTETPQAVYAQWVRGSVDGTYYVKLGNGMFLLGAASDDDGYDDAVILHELGHYVEDAYGETDSPGGAHDGSPTDPRLAWSEGFATFFSGAVRDNPYYMDSMAGGGWYVDLETSVTQAVATETMSQEVSEDMVGEILWDVADAPAGDDDGAGATSTSVCTVQLEYLAEGIGDRGHSGVDLVDWLDGWFYGHGLELCDVLRDIVTTERDFPYDFAGPAGACP